MCLQPTVSKSCLERVPGGACQEMLSLPLFTLSASVKGITAPGFVLGTGGHQVGRRLTDPQSSDTLCPVWPPSVQHGLEVLVLFLHPVREEISVMFASLSPSFNRFALVRAENVYLKS